MPATFYYDVDTQHDFMKEHGRLYVPNAERIIPNLKRLTIYARQDRFGIIAGSVDRHSEGDAELSRNGGPFPDHCMENHCGREKIMETLPVNPVYVPNRRMNFSKLEGLVGNRREMFFEKQHYDVFTNPNAEKVLENARIAVVYGVATDYCVRAAVLGLRDLDVAVFVVMDAIAGVTEDGCKKAIEEMERAGAEFVKTDYVLNGCVNEHIKLMAASMPYFDALYSYRRKK